MRPSTTGHNASIQTSSLLLDARAFIQGNEMAFASRGHPRAALDKGDVRITNVLPQHPVESHRQLPCRTVVPTVDCDHLVSKREMSARRIYTRKGKAGARATQKLSTIQTLFATGVTSRSKPYCRSGD
jgi:hypothetical protein